MKFRTKNDQAITAVDLQNVPEHVAIIMDGNGRWAKKRGLPRVAGHREGMKTIKKIVERAVNLNLKALTLYAFSTENWKRPPKEIEFIMKLPSQFLDTYLPDLKKNNVKVTTIGDYEGLPEATKKAVQYSVDQTKKNTGLVLNFALNYGSRSEIVEAVKHICHDVKDHDLKIEDINESIISQYLYTNQLNDPDLVIRTSGEQRLSNYLLWQVAYSEFYFTQKLWPEFDEKALDEAIIEYQNRKRRFGGL
ncbi:isoprenyl transferase [Tenuibacillus multivorans]|uniref:Isoprenyl transferase n=1 Tax=Tenuibacillus multivorans TaxID=237069 RepID=A0A1G9XX94_9BACI|nr:isoprenyl transferase [Tenuibacillus multivorans]GEL75845.1 isoprenyl transferase [Tenuibacillus multivorans]SDN01121.1 undecaprenyl diphosphate synthase [Tenuibacillus multivorans]